jgi:hypothetical protein
LGLSVKVLSFNIGTGAAASTVTVTPGFQTKCAILFWSGRTETTSTTGAATHLRGMGFFTDAGDFRSVCSRDGHGIGTAVTACGHRADACILEIDSADAMVGWADVQSINATQVVFEILDQFPTSLRVTGIFLGGTDITNNECGTFTTAGVAPVMQDVSTVGGFAPDIVFFLAGPHQADAPSVSVDSTFMFGAGAGVYDGLTAKTGIVCLCGANDSSASGTSGSYAHGAECIAMASIAPQSSPTTRGEFWGNRSAGFTINWLERANPHRIHYLAIKGGRWSLHELLTQTDTTTDIVVSGLGYSPAGGIVASCNKAETVPDAVPAANDEMTVGVFTSTTERESQNVSSLSGNTNMFVATSYRTDAVYVNTNPSTAAVEGLMDVKSIDSDGVTFIMDDADPAQSWAFVAVVAANAVATPSLPIFRRPQLHSRRKVA